METAHPAWPSSIISATLPRLQLHFNEEKVVTLKHMVARLVGPDYGSRKEAMTQTVEADMVDSDQSEDSLALCGSLQPTSGADVSSRLVVARFCVSDLRLELQSQGKPVAEVQVTTLTSLPDQSLLLVDSVSGSLRGSDPASPASPGSPGLSSSPPPSQFDISKALSSLDPSGYSPKSDTSSSSTLPHTNSMPVLPTRAGSSFRLVITLNKVQNLST